MRIIGSLKGKKLGEEFSRYLLSEGISNQCEELVNTDWGSAEYSDVECRIWVYDEDQVEKAIALYEEFKDNPYNPKFSAAKFPKIYSATTTEESQPLEPEVEIIEKYSEGSKSTFVKQKTSPENQPIGIITLYIIFLCITLFLWAQNTQPPQPTVIPTNIPLTPILESPITKKFVYDYPKTYELVDRLVLLYGVEKVQNPQELPVDGLYLFEKYLHTPYWQGIYHIILESYIDPKGAEVTKTQNIPMFEKIQEGEFWRLFTPCLLHANILHILFNLVWFVILGRQMEARLGKFRYLFFILVTGIVSNTAQYLVAGSNFIGISGVLCAMFAFIWMRQRRAAWEGYQLQPGTVAFLTFFILAMFFVQVASFFLEINMHLTISPGIANTAHLAGAAIGVLLGRMRFFSWNALT